MTFNTSSIEWIPTLTPVTLQTRAVLENTNSYLTVHSRAVAIERVLYQTDSFPGPFQQREPLLPGACKRWQVVITPPQASSGDVRIPLCSLVALFPTISTRFHAFLCSRRASVTRSLLLCSVPGKHKDLGLTKQEKINHYSSLLFYWLALLVNIDWDSDIHSCKSIRIWNCLHDKAGLYLYFI